MIELRQFKLPLTTRRPNAFDFERASLALLAKHQSPGAVGPRRRTASALHEPMPPHSISIVQQGVNQHG